VFPDTGGTEAAVKPDAARDASGPDAGREAGVDTNTVMGTCDLLRQNCPQAVQGCYSASGGTECLRRPFEPAIQCIEDGDCSPGAICINDGAGAFQCATLCARPAGICTQSAPCVDLPGYLGVGYCEP
jgi:hypothetical protein